MSILFNGLGYACTLARQKLRFGLIQACINPFDGSGGLACWVKGAEQEIRSPRSTRSHLHLYGFIFALWIDASSTLNGDLGTLRRILG